MSMMIWVPDWTVRMHDKRNKKLETLISYMETMNTVNIYRGEGPLNIFTYGSTTMSVLEGMKYSGMDYTVVQPIYLKPLPTWNLEEFIEGPNIVVEQSSTEQFANLLREKADLEIEIVIKQYDGRPFDPIDLAQKIKEVL